MKSYRRVGHARWQNGFSLIELMIGIALGLLILTGMLVVFANSNATRNEIDRTNRQIENGRYAIELLRDDIQLAGYYGEIDMGKINLLPFPAAMPDPCPTMLVELTNPAGGGAGALRLHTQGVNDVVSGDASAAPGSPRNLSCLKDASGNFLVQPGTDVVVIRRAKTCIAGAADCDPIVNTKPYLQIPLCTKPPVNPTSNTTTHALALGGDGGEFVHRVNNINCTNSASLRPYVIYLYFVSNPAFEADGIPKLKRAEFIVTTPGTGAGTMANITSLVDGIENLQVDYGVDTLDAAVSPTDGSPNSYMTAADINAVTTKPVLDVWTDVVSVQINLLARNLEASPNAGLGTKTYNLGPSGATVSVNDNIRRHVYNTQIRITNVSARREKP